MGNNTNNKNSHLGLAIALMIVFALARVPGIMPENFSPAYALAFCAGVYFPGALAWWLPLGTLLLSDIVLNVFYYNVPALSPFMFAIYGVYALIILLGKRFRHSSFLTLLGGGLVGALMFYLITNTISWLVDPGYHKSFMGWIQSLTVGLPGYPPTWEFFKNTLLSGGLFTGLFAGSMKIAEFVSEKEESEEPEEESEPQESPTTEKTSS